LKNEFGILSTAWNLSPLGMFLNARAALNNAFAQASGAPTTGDAAAAAQAQLNALTAQAAQNAANMPGALPDAGSIAEQLARGSSARSTFNRDVVSGFGSSPVQQLISNTARMIELLDTIAGNTDESGFPTVMMEVG